jgi:sugar-phosphatase
MRVEEVVLHWAARIPGKINHIETTAQDIINEVMHLIEEKGKAMPGVEQAIAFFQSKGLPLAIASASSYALIYQVVEKLGLANKFQVIQSAEQMRYGKPHPEVFLTAAELLGKDPLHCLVLEDSVYGLLPVNRRMKVIAVPDPEHFNRKEYIIAEAKLHSLEEITAEVFDLL